MFKQSANGMTMRGYANDMMNMQGKTSKGRGLIFTMEALEGPAWWSLKASIGRGR